jgi:AcrR family transcriptional regulator
MDPTSNSQALSEEEAGLPRPEDEEDGRGRYDRGESLSERAANQRLRILWATLELLDERGAVGLTVEPIIAKARVGRNTFYAHFDNMADLLGGAREFALDRLFDRLDALERACVTPRERLRELSRAWVHAATEESIAARAALSHTVGLDARHLGTRAQERLVRRIDAIASQAVRDGWIAETPSGLLLQVLAGAFVGAALGVLDPRRPPECDPGDRLARALMGALRA